MNKRGVITIIVVFAGLFLLFMGFTFVMVSSLGEGNFTGTQNRVGVVEIKGMISESKKTVEQIDKFVDNDSIAAIVIRVDSPGGAVAPSQEIYEALRRAKKKKPLAVSMGTTAASGGYYIACGADTIFANPGTITGSIGVVSQLFNVSEVLDKVDIEVHTIRSGPNKASGSPFTEFTDEEREVFREMVDDIYDQFVEDVAESRGLPVDEVRPLADGRVYTGRQAKKLDLVDRLGTLSDAVDFVAEKAELDGEPELVYPPKKTGGLLEDLLQRGVDSAVDGVKSRAAPSIEYRMVAP
jgi:protease-4